MPVSSTTSQLSPAELAYLHSSLSSDPPIRPDSRLPSDFRPFSAETNVLPNTMGSAHVGFADGREAVVGIRAEVEKTAIITTNQTRGPQPMADVQMAGLDDQNIDVPRGKASWISLSLTLPGLRDDDQDLVFLEEMLRETLVAPATNTIVDKLPVASLQDALVINSRWHWRLHIDLVLVSPPEGSAAGSYPVPLLSMAIHLALRDTRIPKLKSEAEEDPLPDDDWEASVWLFAKPGKPNSSLIDAVPPVTLLVMVVGDNVIFDPSATELAIADAVLAVSIARHRGRDTSDISVLAVRMLEFSARDTFKGVPKNETANAWENVPGVWTPRIGGIKTATFKKVVKATMADVGRDVLAGLEAYVTQLG